MKLKKTYAAVAMGAAALFGAAAPAQAQISGDVIRIGVITDMSSVYADIGGQGSVEAIRMAIAEMGGAIGGKKIEVISADHQNKPDVAATKAREWFDTQGVDMLIGGTNSGTNLAMAKVAQEKKKPFISVGAATSALTNEQCSPYTLHWAYDTAALAVDVRVHAGHVGDDADADDVTGDLGDGRRRGAEHARGGEGAGGEELLEFHAGLLCVSRGVERGQTPRNSCSIAVFACSSCWANSRTILPCSMT